MYIYPLGANAESILSCPHCKARLHYNANFTSFVCGNTSCNAKYSFMEIRRRMDLSLEDMENQVIAELNAVEMPDFDNFTEDVYSDDMAVIKKPLNIDEDIKIIDEIQPDEIDNSASIGMADEIIDETVSNLEKQQSDILDIPINEYLSSNDFDTLDPD